MRVWVPRLASPKGVAVDIDGYVATFCTGERQWRWRRTLGGVECLSDVVATPQQRGQAKSIAEKAFRMAEDRLATG